MFSILLNRQGNSPLDRVTKFSNFPFFGFCISPKKYLHTLLRTFRVVSFVVGMGILAQLSGCSGISLPPISNPFPNFGDTTTLPGPIQTLPAIAGQSYGSGPVRVALLLPLSGDIAGVGQSMSNAAQLAMDFIEQSPSIGSNITLIIKDTAGNSSIAAAKASEAINEGASLILGPLRADSVRAAGAVASSSGIPLIGFSNNTGAASPGVYLLNVLPETEVKRSLAYAQSQGKQSIAAIIPNTEFGQIQEAALRQAAASLGMAVRGIYRFSNEIEARDTVAQIVPFLKAGAIDTLFIPDRSTASSFGVLLEEAEIDKSNLLLIGSLDWAGDIRIHQTQFLVGAIYPSVDEGGLAALRPSYEAKFGVPPHALSTISYTAVLLANSQSLSQSQPRYQRDQLIRPSGFNGRDGLFRFLADGRSEYAMVSNRLSWVALKQLTGQKYPKIAPLYLPRGSHRFCYDVRKPRCNKS